MKLSIKNIFLSFTLCALQVFTFGQNLPLDSLIAKTNNPKLKKQLADYQTIGIEKNIEIDSTYSSDAIVTIAMSYLNTRHVMGGTSHKGIDCSGLIYASFKELGIQMPHSSHEQARFGKVIDSRDSLQKGDLLFFYNSYTSHNLITHVGIYLGNDRFIHTSASAGVVITALSNSDYWSSRYLFSTRIKNIE